MVDKDTYAGRRITMAHKQGEVVHAPIPRRRRERTFLEKVADTFVALVVGWCFILGAGVTYYAVARVISETLGLHFWDVVIMGLVMVFILTLWIVLPVRPLKNKREG
jgi:hypothetical protein